MHTRIGASVNQRRMQEPNPTVPQWHDNRKPDALSGSNTVMVSGFGPIRDYCEWVSVLQPPVAGWAVVAGACALEDEPVQAPIQRLKAPPLEEV